MLNTVPISYFTKYADLITEWGEHRICQNTIDYIRLTSRNYSIGYAIHSNEETVAISIASRNWPYAAIATNPNHRRQGHAKRLLKQTLQHFHCFGLTYQAWVASDNIASVKLFKDNDFDIIQTATKDRESGPYTAYLFASKDKDL